MKSEDSRRVVLDAWETFKTRDPERIAAMFTEDAEWLAQPNNATATALNGPSHMIGKDQIAQLIGKEIWKLFTANVAIDFRGVYADGDVVIVEERMRATLPNPSTTTGEVAASAASALVRVMVAGRRQLCLQASA